MLKNITVKVAVVVLSILIVKPVVAADTIDTQPKSSAGGKIVKDDSKILQPFCRWLGLCPPVDPIDPGKPEIIR